MKEFEENHYTDREFLSTQKKKKWGSWSFVKTHTRNGDGLGEFRAAKEKMISTQLWILANQLKQLYTTISKKK